jgi:hypothetical protein
MKLWALLGVAFLLIYLRPQIREHLEPTDRIKDPGPGGMYDEAEKDRIFSLMPFTLQWEYQWDVPGAREIEEADRVRRVKNELARSIADFYTDVYASATEPITESQISPWIRTRYGAQPPRTAQLTTDALKIYFIDQAPPPPPTGGTGAPPPVSPPEPAERQPISGAPVTVTIEVHPDGTTHVTNPRAGARGIRAEQSATRDV